MSTFETYESTCVTDESTWVRSVSTYVTFVSTYERDVSTCVYHVSTFHSKCVDLSSDLHEYVLTCYYISVDVLDHFLRYVSTYVCKGVDLSMLIVSVVSTFEQDCVYVLTRLT